MHFFSARLIEENVWELELQKAYEQYTCDFFSQSGVLLLDLKQHAQ